MSDQASGEMHFANFHHEGAYIAHHKHYEADFKAIDENRFVKFEERETRSVLTVEMVKVLDHGKLSWLNFRLSNFIAAGPKGKSIVVRTSALYS